MRFKSFAACALIGLAQATAWGEVNTRVEWQTSTDGSSWSSGMIFVPAGGTVQVRAVVSYTGTVAPLGLGSMVFQPTISHWSDGTIGTADTLLPFFNGGVGGNQAGNLGVVPPDGPGYGRVSPWGRTATTATTFIRGHLHSGGSGGAPAGTWMRIAQNHTTAWLGGAGNTTGFGGVSIAQLNNAGRTTADPAFNSQLQGIVVFRMGITFGVMPFERTVTISALFGPGTSGFTYDAAWFASMIESVGSIRGDVDIIDATVFVAPTPGTALCLAAGGLMLGRRRRAST